MKKVLLICGTVVVSVAVAALILVKGCQSGIETAMTEASKPHQTETAVSMDQFERLKTNMTYEEVCAILGGKGRELSRADVAGTSMVIYAWDGNGGIGANMNATFQNNKLTAKAQFGLR
jgi:hypothetical protein